MRKIIPALVTGATTLVVATVTFGYVTLDKDVELSVDGVGGDVSTMAGTVGQVLQSKGIELGEHDVVAPALDTKLSDGTKIAVQYGRQIRVSVDGQPQTYWTTATRVDDALASLDLPADGAALSTSRSTPISREGISFNLATRKTITIDNAGKTERITTTAQTVGAALDAADIKIDGDDLLSSSEDTALRNGSTFTVTKVDVKTIKKSEKVDFKTTYTDSDTLEKGKTAVKTAGKAGVREIEITEVRHNGVLQSRETTKSKLATPPRTAVVLRGTKEPAPAPAEPADSNAGNADAGNNANADDNANANADTSNSGADQDPGTDDSASDDSTGDQNAAGDSAGASDAVWDRVAQCESGQNWSINTGNGYFGGLQFARRSWTAYGGTEYADLASEATREQQIIIANKILADVGWKAWPACSRKLGLR